MEIYLKTLLEWLGITNTKINIDDGTNWSIDPAERGRDPVLY